ncbi:hypothetical protein BHU72_00380 [Desulfuribacillus stibiiarsenatis]|uniref:Flagellar hook-associated protein 2 n=1 Tax=Desulfuribacillus stibiiarsenatis TaxID=1390249 RepID=A0A1E5L9G8_9FIRM|nr:flagellar hook-associated protein 2 [Desulfuribacillus stibiiarsenatis]OEH86766.1 hypothetical protein BHU72_00380 [Desulfuribacillus stibiiarsenatis]
MTSPIRFGGIASGLDTESMIKQLMRAERFPLDRMFQKKRITEWQQEEYRSINTKMLDFRTSASNIRLQGTFLARKVTSTNEAAVSAKSTGASSNFTSQIEVTQLAKAGFRNSAEDIAITDTKSKTALADYAGDKFSINGREFTVRADESVEDLLKRINDAKIGVSAFYDSTTKKVSISSHTPGANKLQITDTDGFLTNQLKLTDGFAGQDALFKLNGLETSRDSNTFTINNVEYTLKAEGTSTISSSTDTDKIMDTIKDYITKYNDLITSTQEKLTEKKYRSYPPLTDEQKKDMTDKEIELWEEKARSGLLRGDSLLTNMLSDLRTMMSDQVKGLGAGKISSLFDIGIKSNNYQERGLLHIDENKLREALETKPDEVIALFTAQSENVSEKGIGTRVYDSLNIAIDRVTQKAGRANMSTDNSFMSKELRRFDSQMELFEKRLTEKEERYWKQFTAMEKALQELNSQGDWLMAQLSQPTR